jgi:hypothetical protein
MGDKVYSVVIKNQRFDLTAQMLEDIKKGVTSTEGGRKFVHFTKDGHRVDILKEDFDKALNTAKANVETIAKPEETK